MLAALTGNSGMNKLMGRVESKIANAKVAHMSNAKWRKLFQACEEYPQVIGGTSWKFIGYSSAIISTLCANSSLLDDERFADCDPSPYADLKEIEWVHIPMVFSDAHEDKHRPLPKQKNDISAITEHLNTYGNFPIIEVENGVNIIGYEW